MKLLTRLLPLIVALAMLGPFAVPAQANEGNYGYLWSIEFDFEHSFNGILTIKVGPWENGTLSSIDETSTTRVYCRRVGNVSLNGGDAVFNGGYLRCELDLATVVLKNHGLKIDTVDTYRSVLMSSTLESTAANVAPIFWHPDMQYGIDFTQTWAVTLQQELWNGAGLLQHQFINPNGFVKQPYTMVYDCDLGGPCDAWFQAGPDTQLLPTAGNRVQFNTAPTSFLVGGDGVTTFSGRMADLLIDPGNSVH